MIELDLNKFFKEVSGRYSIETVFLYGSFAKGFPRPDSDIDLAIVFSADINNPEKAHYLITEISYALTIILKREVNIIAIDRDFSHPMLYYNAIVLGIPVYIKDNDKFLSLKLYALHQMEDFQIFGINWQREIAEKNIKGE